MSADPSHLEAVLSELEMEREEIDKAIAVIRRRLERGESPASASNQPPTGGGSRMSAQVLSPDSIPRNAFSGQSLPDAVKAYLRMVNQKQTPRQIFEGLQRGGFHTTAKNLYSNCYTTLLRLESQGEAVKFGDRNGEWGLVEWFPHLRKERGRERRVTDDAASQKISLQTDAKELKDTKGAKVARSKLSSKGTKKVSLRQRIVEILTEAGAPLTIDETRQRMTDKGYSFNLRSLKTSLAAMASDGPEGRGLYRDGPAKYGLKKWRQGRSADAHGQRGIH